MNSKVMSQTMDTTTKILELQIQNLSEAQKIVGIGNEGVANSLAAHRDAAELLKLLSTASGDISSILKGVNMLVDKEHGD